MTLKLEDRWASRDLPVLISVAKALDASPGRILQAEAIVDTTGLERDAVISALIALNNTYIIGEPMILMGRGVADFTTSALTERGLRAAGLWPDGETVDALVDALRQAEEATDDPDEKTLIRRAAGAVGSISKSLMTDVLAAYVRQQTGL